MMTVALSLPHEGPAPGGDAAPVSHSPASALAAFDGDFIGFMDRAGTAAGEIAATTPGTIALPRRLVDGSNEDSVLTAAPSTGETSAVVEGETPPAKIATTVGSADAAFSSTSPRPNLDSPRLVLHAAQTDFLVDRAEAGARPALARGAAPGLPMPKLAKPAANNSAATTKSKTPPQTKKETAAAVPAPKTQSAASAVRPPATPGQVAAASRPLLPAVATPAGVPVARSVAFVLAPSLSLGSATAPPALATRGKWDSGSNATSTSPQTVTTAVAPVEAVASKSSDQPLAPGPTTGAQTASADDASTFRAVAATFGSPLTVPLPIPSTVSPVSAQPQGRLPEGESIVKNFQIANAGSGPRTAGPIVPSVFSTNARPVTNLPGFTAVPSGESQHDSLDSAASAVAQKSVPPSAPALQTPAAPVVANVAVSTGPSISPSLPPSVPGVASDQVADDSQNLVTLPVAMNVEGEATPVPPAPALPASPVKPEPDAPMLPPQVAPQAQSEAPDQLGGENRNPAKIAAAQNGIAEPLPVLQASASQLAPPATNAATPSIPLRFASIVPRIPDSQVEDNLRNSMANFNLPDWSGPSAPVPPTPAHLVRTVAVESAAPSSPPVLTGTSNVARNLDADDHQLSTPTPALSAPPAAPAGLVEAEASVSSGTTPVVSNPLPTQNQSSGNRPALPLAVNEVVSAPLAGDSPQPIVLTENIRSDTATTTATPAKTSTDATTQPPVVTPHSGVTQTTPPAGAPAADFIDRTPANKFPAAPGLPLPEPLSPVETAVAPKDDVLPPPAPDLAQAGATAVQTSPSASSAIDEPPVTVTAEAISAQAPPPPANPSHPVKSANADSAKNSTLGKLIAESASASVSPSPSKPGPSAVVKQAPPFDSPATSPSGTPVATDDVRMKSAVKQNEIAGSTVQELPLAGQIASVTGGSAGASLSAKTSFPISINFSPETDTSAQWMVLGSTPGAATRMTMTANADSGDLPSVSPFADVERLISREVSMVRQSGAQSLAVTLKVDSGTSLFLQLTNHNGQIEAAVRYEKGGPGGLEGHWPELQESLARQNVQLLPLPDNSSGPAKLTPPAAGDILDHQHGQPQPEPHPQAAEEIEVPPSDDAMNAAVGLAKSKHRSHSRHGWEKWA